jgi:hypothetical protein
MGLDSTITEQDMDATSQQFVQSMRNYDIDLEPDLSVDGFSESIVGKLLRILTFGRW